MKTLALLAMATSPAALAWTPGTYSIDTAHSKVGFEVPHLVIATVEGRFNEYRGEVVVGEKLEDSKVSVAIDAKSVDTGNAKRDEHLRSADFLDVEKHPKLTFRSRRVTGKREAFKVVGDLTLHGVTREVTLDGKFLGTAKDGWGNLKAAFAGEARINRKDYGLVWNKIVEIGPTVGEEVTIRLKVQGAKSAGVAAR